MCSDDAVILKINNYHTMLLIILCQDLIGSIVEKYGRNCSGDCILIFVPSISLRIAAGYSFFCNLFFEAAKKS